MAGKSAAKCGILLFLLFSAGCAAVTNPAKEGIPVELVEPALLARPKNPQMPITLSQLGQPPPEIYLLGPGDLLGVYIEGVLGGKAQGPPVVGGTLGSDVPSLGYPIPVREDGTIRLPLVPPIQVGRMSLVDAEKKIEETYINQKVIQPGQARLVVTLTRKRVYRVVVFRDELENFNTPLARGLTAFAGGGKRGNGHVVELPAYEDDVLHALAATGGPPGIDDYNEVVIEHRGGHVVRIPLRICPGEPLPFGPADVLLQEGDVVYLEARDIQRFYAGGLLPPGEYVLPRDYDLDVVTAIAFIRGPLINGGFGGSNLSGTLIEPGIGGPSPKLVTIIRRTPDGGQIRIRVDLDRAVCDAHERIVIKAGDLLILQETPCQAVTRYVSQTLTNFSFLFVTTHPATTTTISNP